MSKQAIRWFIVCLLVIVPGTMALAQGGTINAGDVIEGSVTNGTVEYQFTAKAGETLSISLSSDDFDTYLDVLDSSGNVIASDDDSGGGLNSALFFSPPAAGAYTIVVRSFGGSATGSYTLSFSAARVVSLAYNSTTPLVFTAGDAPLQFTLDGQAGDVLNIYTDNGEVDVRISLHDPEGTEFAYDDDGGVGLASYLRRTVLPASGTYRLVVEPYSTSTTGTTNLVVEQTTLVMLGVTPQTITLGSDISTERFAFEAAAGGRYRLTVRANVSATAYVDIELGLYESISLNFTDVLEASAVFEIPESGLFSVSIDDYSWRADSVDYQISITPAE